MTTPVTVVPLAFKDAAPGFRTVDLFHGELPLEPFLVFTEFHMSRAIFGPHPHAGMTVVTYMLPDSAGGFLNRDSFGDRSRIGPGAVHATQAGAGIMHDEFPEPAGIDCHGMQIWINHADADRFVPPKAMHADGAAIPEREVGAHHVRVVLGAYGAAVSPIALVTPVGLLDVTLRGATPFALPDAATRFVYVLRGRVSVDGVSATAPALLIADASAGSLALTSESDDSQVLIASGTPHGEPIAHGGPFVGTTPAQISEMRRRFGSGAMGQLAAAG
ncbi:MAG: pirin family protein [Gemmatimonadaceae bacterium]|nr:pirin family protein [Gemmatimonadaceae bacterium]